MFEVDSSTDEQHEDLEENMSFVDFVTLFILLDGSTFSDHLPGRYPWGPIPEDPGMVRVHTVGGGNVGQTCRGVARVIFCVQPFSLFTAEEDNILPSVLSETLNNSSIIIPEKYFDSFFPTPDFIPTLWYIFWRLLLLVLWPSSIEPSLSIESQSGPLHQMNVWLWIFYIDNNIGATARHFQHGHRSKHHQCH